MSQKNRLNIFLAVLGTLLVWIPILAPAFFTVVRYVRSGLFRFDYLMPAELGLLAFAGGLLLFWVSIRIHVYQKVVATCLATMFLTLVGGMALASATGSASGAMDRAGWQWTLVALSLVLYSIALVILVFCGLFLVKEVFR